MAAAVLSAGDQHDRFVAWSQQSGVMIDGLAPARFKGRGLGIVAARDLKVGEVLIKVPPKCLIHIDSAPVRQLNLPRKCSVHGRLAAYLTLVDADPGKEHALWQATWPTMDDFRSILPFCWDEKAKENLTPPAKALLASQVEKVEKDLKHLKDFITPGLVDSFRYFWLIINTRCFYWDYPLTPPARLPKKRSDLKGIDCLALCPFADYFNHVDEGCKVKSDKNGFTVTCHKNYKAGDEVYISYGAHNNDFLLVEYGFMLSGNEWDYTTLDHLILPTASKTQREILEEDGFLGSYILSPLSPYIDHRTQSTLRLLSLPPTRARRRYDCFISGSDDGEIDQDIVDAALRTLLREFRAECDGMRLRAVTEVLGDTLAKRWEVTGEIVGAALRALGE